MFIFYLHAFALYVICGTAIPCVRLTLLFTDRIYFITKKMVKVIIFKNFIFQQLLCGRKNAITAEALFNPSMAADMIPPA